MVRMSALRDREIWQLRVELLDVTPIVWRRLLVPATITLPKLHRVLQATMGWTDSHLHEFVMGGKRYGVPDPEWSAELPMIDERRVVLGRILDPDDRSFSYLYDFGDDWHHAVLVESRHVEQLPGQPVVTCTAGENACPPEDVGGPPGYSSFLEAMADPRHLEREDYLNWIGGRFDPGEFDVKAVNKVLAAMKI